MFTRTPQCRSHHYHFKVRETEAQRERKMKPETTPPVSGRARDLSLGSWPPKVPACNHHAEVTPSVVPKRRLNQALAPCNKLSDLTFTHYAL